jgi:hypothetical protein
MIQALLILIKILLGLSIAALLMGLIKPVYVLWYMDRFNRLKVIRIYGTLILALVFFLSLIRLVL